MATNIKTEATLVYQHPDGFTLVYQHPDGFTLAFNDNVLTATDDEDNTVCLPIGPLGLIALGELLTAIGRNREFHGC